MIKNYIREDTAESSPWLPTQESTHDIGTLYEFHDEQAIQDIHAHISANRFFRPAIHSTGEVWSLDNPPLYNDGGTTNSDISPAEITNYLSEGDYFNAHQNWPRWQSDQMTRNHAIGAACDILRLSGKGRLADRLTYFASDEDLDDGDVSLTEASAFGFLSFLSMVESEGNISLTCSPEGWLCAVWRFPDNRRASIWFLDENRVMFAATDANGKFLTINGGGEQGPALEVMAKLVDAGLLTWSLDSRNFHMTTMLHGTAVSETLQKMAFLPRMPFYSEWTQMNPFFQQTGVNTSTLQTELSKLTALFTP
jgi:hypothetical protein